MVFVVVFFEITVVGVMRAHEQADLYALISWQYVAYVGTLLCMRLGRQYVCVCRTYGI